MKKLINIMLPPLTFMTIMSLCIWAAVYYGIEEKSWLSQYWHSLAGGGVGLGIGIAIAIVYGGFGIVTGGLSFGIHALGICVISTLSGLGIGSMTHVSLNPSLYNFNWHVIVPMILIGILFSNGMSNVIRKTVQFK